MNASDYAALRDVANSIRNDAFTTTEDAALSQLGKAIGCLVEAVHDGQGSDGVKVADWESIAATLESVAEAARKTGVSHVA
jgi:hypothetical protein